MGILGIGLTAAGLIGSYSASQKKIKYDSSAMDSALSLIEEQYGNINTYFNQANTAFESQYQNYYGQSMQDAVNSIAGSGIYESPVSQNFLNRQQVALGETYASGKSSLAGQKLTALGSVDQQKIQYYQNLASLQYSRAQAKASKQSSIFSTIAGVGAALL